MHAYHLRAAKKFSLESKPRNLIVRARMCPRALSFLPEKRSTGVIKDQLAPRILRVFHCPPNVSTANHVDIGKPDLSRCTHTSGWTLLHTKRSSFEQSMIRHSRSGHDGSLRHIDPRPAHARGKRIYSSRRRRRRRRARVEWSVDEKVIRKFHGWKVVGVVESLYEYPFLESGEP